MRKAGEQRDERTAWQLPHKCAHILAIVGVSHRHKYMVDRHKLTRNQGCEIIGWQSMPEDFNACPGWFQVAHKRLGDGQPRINVQFHFPTPAFARDGWILCDGIRFRPAQKQFLFGNDQKGAFPMTRRVWKSYRPTSMRDALRACRDYAIEKKNLSVERVADLMGVTDDQLYSWQSKATMPAAQIPVYEHVCGVAYVTEYMAEIAQKIVISIPKGHLDAQDVQTLQGVVHDAVGALIDLMAGKSDHEKTLTALMLGMQSLAWHHANVKKHQQPELDLN